MKAGENRSFYTPPSEHDIVIVGACDDNYARHLSVAFVSLLINASDPSRCRLFCLDGGLKEGSRSFLENAVSGHGGRLDFIGGDWSEYKGFGTVKHITHAAYYRVSIPELFDDSVEKAIYLDCDVIVKADISELWDADIGDCPVGAVENIAKHTFLKSGLEQKDYFNSGVMLLNLRRWRKDNIASQVRDFKVSHPERISTNDQCAINGVLKGDWFHLPLRWNQQTGIYRESKQVKGLPADQVEAARFHPSIIHYIGSDKPWNAVCFHPFQGEYWRYAARLGIEQPANLKRVCRRAAFSSFSLFKKFIRKWVRQWRLRRAGVSLYL
ncbi:MAG: glycosyltransferase family 8 protein [Alcanivorax sp.]|nr:glycosyltransferase family 8 protein [Alcanivorax sp.]